MMRAIAWLGPGVLVIGLILGALLAGGMYAAEAASRAQVTPVPVGPVAAPAPLTLQTGTGDAERGRVPYERSCAGCHGSTGRSDTPLHGPLLKAYYPDDRVLAGLIRNGVGTMPGTPPNELPDQDIPDVIAYMRAFP
jgi:mono/diheme cytochrome c family protein